MGKLMSKMQDVLGDLGTNPSRILMLGLDAAGKTTILYKLKLDSDIQTVPTIGFNVETVKVCKGVTFTVWDVGGQEKLRRLWSLYFKGSHGILYVVDSNDRERVAAARKELLRICLSAELASVPLIVVANKQDLPTAMTPAEVADVLCLDQLKDRHWHVQGACATSGQGLVEVMTSLAVVVKSFKKKRSFTSLPSVMKDRTIRRRASFV